MSKVILFHLYGNDDESIILEDHQKPNNQYKKQASFWAFSPTILPISSHRLSLIVIQQGDGFVMKNASLSFDPSIQPQKNYLYFVVYNKPFFKTSPLYFITTKKGVMCVKDRPKNINDIKFVIHVLFTNNHDDPYNYSCINSKCVPTEYLKDPLFKDIYIDRNFSNTDTGMSFEHCNKYCGGIKKQLYNILEQVKKEDEDTDINRIHVNILLFIFFIATISIIKL